MGEYSYIITNAGLAKIAAFLTGGPEINISHIAVGDGNGSSYTPVATQTALVNEVKRVTVNNRGIDSINTAKLFLMGTIPASDYGYAIREAGLFDSTGTLIAVRKYPLIDKITEGNLVEVFLKEELIVSNTSAFTLTIDPNIIIANQAWVTGQVSDHNTDANAHSSLFAGKSNTGHLHDDRYYTETESDARFAALAGLSTQNFSVADATQNSHAVNLGQLNAIRPDIYVPYSVNSGNKDTDNLANIIKKVSDSEISFAVNTTEYYADYLYRYIQRVGTPAYSGNVYTLNGTDQALIVPKLNTLGTGTWEIKLKVKWNTTNTNYGIIDTGSAGAGYGVCLQRTSANKLMLKLSSNSSSWDILDGTGAGVGLGAKVDWGTSTYYYIKVYFTGTAYKVDWSTDGTSWTNELTKTSSTLLYSNFTQLWIGLSGSTPYRLAGYIDMSGVKFAVGSNVIFDGSQSYIAPNIVVTFPNGKIYEISQIANITGITSDGTYTIIIKESNLTKLETGTYSAIATAVKLGYTALNNFTPVLGADSQNGWTAWGNSISSGSAYQVVDGNSSTYMETTGGGDWGIYFPTTKTLAGIVIESNSTLTNFAINTTTDGGATWSANVDGITYNETISTKTIIFSSPISCNGFKINGLLAGNPSTIKYSNITMYESITYSGGNIIEDYILGSGSNNSVSYTAINPTGMTSNTKDGFTLSATVDNANAYKACDGTNAYWSTSTNGSSIKIQCPSSFVANRLYLYNHATTFPTADVLLEGSTDNVTFTPMLSLPAFDLVYGGPVIFYNTSSYTYFRVTFTNISGGPIQLMNFFVYSQTTVSSGADGDYFVDLSQRPLKPYKNNSGNLLEEQFVKAGELTRTSATIGNPISYAFNGKYKSAERALAAGGVTTTFSHNIGIADLKTKLYAKNISTDGGYAVGDIITPVTNNGTQHFPIDLSISGKNSVSYTINSSGVYYEANNKTTGAFTQLVTAKWTQFAVIERGF